MHLVRCWRNDYEIWKWCRQNDFISDVEQASWFKRQSEDPTIKMYKIVMSFNVQRVDENKKQKKILPIGVCGLTSINMTNRNAEFSLYIAPAYQGNHFGPQALKCLLTHGFSNLGLYTIWGEVFEGNPALDSFLSIGFQKEGLRKCFYYRDGKFLDAHLISINATEWFMDQDK